MNRSSPDWDRLNANHPEGLVTRLRNSYEHGEIAYVASDLANDASTLKEDFSEQQALALLEDAGAWLSRSEEPGEVDEDFPDEPRKGVTRFVWKGEARRQISWLILIHGMNTDGRWQELLAFDVSLWQGGGVPTFIHKYGWVVLGVVLPWRRRKFKRELREQVVALKHSAAKHRLHGKPDVVAHSFGTWLLGHVLLEEHKRASGSEIEIGRVILTGSVLEPDFPWAKLQEAGLVEDVLNHYATNDRVVPLAHWVVWDSGPSGCRGFDLLEKPADGVSNEETKEVVNIKAEEFGHSQVFFDEERYVSYSESWKPFLTNPKGQASRNLEIEDPERRWSRAWWPIRGTLLPFVVLLLLSALLVYGLLAVGPAITLIRDFIEADVATSVWVLWRALVALVALYGLYGIWFLVRRRGRGR